MDRILIIGEEAVKFILSVAQLLVNDGAPGIVSILFIVTLIFLVAIYWSKTSRITNSVNIVRGCLNKTSGEAEFAESFIEVDRSITEAGRQNKHVKILSDAWSEFKETLMLPLKVGDFVKNTFRPSTFFNRDDLGFSHRGWRQVPSIFVSIGLLATFLGLISALKAASGSMEASSENSAQALTDLLTVATAKFIMSLTGLACSILFTLAFRLRTKNVDQSFRELCKEIEDRVVFQTPETIAFEQLKAIRDQGETLKIFSNDLVANLSRALREDLPNSIRESVREAIEPVARQISESSTAGVGEMVDKLSEKLSGGIDASLNSVSETLITVGENLNAVASRLDGSSNQMGQEMEAAVAKLTDSISQVQAAAEASSSSVAEAMTKGTEELLTAMNNVLEDISRNTADGATQLQDAAAKIANAGEIFSSAIEASVSEASDKAKSRMNDAASIASAGIDEAGGAVVNAMSGAISDLEEKTKSFATALDGGIGEPIEELRSAISGLSSSVTTSTARLGEFGREIDNSAGLVSIANEELGQASEQFRSAMEPIQSVVNDLKVATQSTATSMANASDAIAKGVNENRQAVIDAVNFANDAVRASREAVEKSLNGLDDAIGKFGDVVTRYDEIDEKLGDAFGKIETSVRTSISSIEAFTNDMHTRLEEALTALRSVIEMANEFDPQRSDAERD
jgi:uncharacterized protein YukE